MLTGQVLDAQTTNISTAQSAGLADEIKDIPVYTDESDVFSWNRFPDGSIMKVKEKGNVFLFCYARGSESGKTKLRSTTLESAKNEGLVKMLYLS